MSIFALLSNAASIATVLTSALAIGKRLNSWKKAPHREVSSNIRHFFVGLVLLMIPAILVSWVSPSQVPPPPPPPSPTATQVTFTPQPTQTTPSPYLDIQGTYSGHEQCPELALLPDSFMLTITHVFTTTQQNQQSFQGTFTDASATCGNSPYNPASIYDINNGTVDQNDNIQFTITRLDRNGNQETITYTGTSQSGRGWQGTFSVSNGAQGIWDAK